MVLLKTDLLTGKLFSEDDNFNRIQLLYDSLSDARIHFINQVYSIKRVYKEYDQRNDLTEKYVKYVKEYTQSHDIALFNGWERLYECNHESLKVDKEITIYYSDKGEYYNLKPIADEAFRRGYKCKFTTDLQDESEIGIYCQHTCYPENAKFSVILLHDMAQGHDIWPNLWGAEHWDHFDLGILPGKIWGSRWSQCAFMSYVRPRFGTWMIGYPKADIVHSDELIQKAASIKSDFKYQFTVLYAPSWENNGKEDDFVSALSDLPINMVIKQGQPNEEVLRIVPGYDKNLEEMRKKHEGKYDNLYYIEPEESIFVALELCDVAVSDESSIMTENLLFEKPSVAVVDWPIPDRNPPRNAVVPYDYVYKTTKDHLRESITEMLNNPHVYDRYVEIGKQFFMNVGNTCSDIMDLIESCIEGKEPNNRLMQYKLRSKYCYIDLWS